MFKNELCYITMDPTVQIRYQTHKTHMCIYSWRIKTFHPKYFVIDCINEAAIICFPVILVNQWQYYRDIVRFCHAPYHHESIIYIHIYTHSQFGSLMMLQNTMGIYMTAMLSSHSVVVHNRILQYLCNIVTDSIIWLENIW